MRALYAEFLPYLQLYLAAGVLTLVISASSPVRAWLRQRKDPASLLSLLESRDPRTQTLWYRIRARVLAPVLAAIAMVLLWPGVPWMKFRQWQRDQEMARWRAAQVFKVRREYLLEKLSVQEIEAREVVQDPLGAVPTLPFGHLSGVWAELIAQLQSRDELWSFSAQWHDRWGRPDLRTGYVAWRRGKPMGHILTMLKPMEDLSVPKQASGDSSKGASNGADEIEIPDFLRRQAD
jgi:hypothetical protein